MMRTAKVPKTFATAVPSIGWVGACALDTTKILPGMPGTRFEHAWFVGATTDWAINVKRLKERNGILDIYVTDSLGRPSIVVDRVPGQGFRKDIINM